VSQRQRPTPAPGHSTTGYRRPGGYGAWDTATVPCRLGAGGRMAAFGPAGDGQRSV